MRLPLVLAAAITVGVAACAPSGAPFGAVRAASRNCADVFASAMATRGQVKGSWECLSPPIQDQFKSAGLEGDAGIATLAQRDPVYTKEQFMGRLADGGYVYGLSSGSASSVLIVWLDNGGHVADVQSGGRGAQH